MSTNEKIEAVRAEVAALTSINEVNFTTDELLNKYITRHLKGELVYQTLNNPIATFERVFGRPVSTVPTRGEHLAPYLEQGVPEEAAQLIDKLKGGGRSRHAARITRLAEISSAFGIYCAEKLAPEVGDRNPQLEAACARILLLSEICGEGGQQNAQGSSTNRHPVFYNTIGSGRRHANDGPAWDAALRRDSHDAVLAECRAILGATNMSEGINPYETLCGGPIHGVEIEPQAGLWGLYLTDCAVILTLNELLEILPLKRLECFLKRLLLKVVYSFSGFNILEPESRMQWHGDGADQWYVYGYVTFSWYYYPDKEVARREWLKMMAVLNEWLKSIEWLKSRIEFEKEVLRNAPPQEPQESLVGEMRISGFR